MPGKNGPKRASDSFRIVGFTTLIRNPLGSSTAAARTKPSNAPETVAPATPAKIGSSLRTPETKVKVPLSLMNGIASWTRLIWPMSLLPNEKNARNQGESSPFVDERDRLLDQTDLAHELAPQRKLPIFSGELRKWGEYDFACRNGHGVKRTDDLIELPDTFSALDIDLEIA